MTGKRKELLIAIRDGSGGVFHKSTVEQLEREGMIFFIGGLRLVGCNGFAPRQFVLTDLGEAVASKLVTRKRAA